MSVWENYTYRRSALRDARYVAREPRAIAEVFHERIKSEMLAHVEVFTHKDMGLLSLGAV